LWLISALRACSQIIDNAPTHVAREVFGIVVALLERFGVQLIRLPKYCPEYNPCEMVWAQVRSPASGDDR